MTRTSPAGDFDYERHGHGYSQRRRPDPRIAAMIHRAFGDARTVLNVGAGAGSYEPDDRYVAAIEPSAMMRAQRSPERVPAINATAEDLPFDDDSFDAVMATITIHQWNDPEAGLREMPRVSRNQVVILTFDAAALEEFWLREYVPEVIAIEQQRYPAIERIVRVLGGSTDVLGVPIPRGAIRVDARGSSRDPTRSRQACGRSVLRCLGRTTRPAPGAERTHRRRAARRRAAGFAQQGDLMTCRTDTPSRVTPLLGIGGRRALFGQITQAPQGFRVPPVQHRVPQPLGNEPAGPLRHVLGDPHPTAVRRLLDLDLDVRFTGRPCPGLKSNRAAGRVGSDAGGVVQEHRPAAHRVVDLRGRIRPGLVHIPDPGSADHPQPVEPPVRQHGEDIRRGTVHLPLGDRHVISLLPREVGSAARRSSTAIRGSIAVVGTRCRRPGNRRSGESVPHRLDDRACGQPDEVSTGRSVATWVTST